ncbi:MAG: virulence protein RhuM/Fic/DOC family protein [Candidatus Peribacteraceae bacterium]|nr:virulence protein RhuM/Fic/DOC family protein [Candidatus Peribacteraceae bacterium]
MAQRERQSPSSSGEIILYTADNGQTKLDVTLEEETVWLSQKQMSELFQKNVRTINEHILNIFKEGELKRKSVIRKFRITANDGKTYETTFYNLDVIISVGYRVKSKRGTLFRQWALNVLRDHIVQGFTVNERRLRERKEGRLKELGKAISLLQDTMYRQELTRGEAVGLLHVITDYARSWVLLEQFDQKAIAMPEHGTRIAHPLSYQESTHAVEKLREELVKRREAGTVFGVERERGLQSILANLEQTFGGQHLYRTVEEKAAHLLYFVIKDHPFVDGNKRIGSLLFILYLSRNNRLLRSTGERRVSDNALVAVALLVAESKPQEKEIMIALIANLLQP